MPDLILQVWKLVLLGFMYLFLLRIVRAIWANLRTPVSAVSLDSPPPKVKNKPQYSDNPNSPNNPNAKPKKRGSLKYLKVIQPKEQASTFELGQEITIGRAPGCKVRIEDTFVSQLHARVFMRNDSYFVEDLGSTNGTLHNGNPVGAPIALKRGDKIQVGQTILEVSP